MECWRVIDEHADAESALSYAADVHRVVFDPVRQDADGIEATQLLQSATGLATLILATSQDGDEGRRRRTAPSWRAERPRGARRSRPTRRSGEV